MPSAMEKAVSLLTKIAALKEKKKDPLAFRMYVLEFKHSCPALGMGCQRATFDWVQRSEDTSTGLKYQMGFEGECMSFPKYVKWYMTEHEPPLAKDDAEARWFKEKQNPQHPREQSGETVKQ